MTRAEVLQVQLYLRNAFGTERITVQGRKDKDDSAEVTLAGEFVGVVFRDDEEGEVSYDFHMTILSEDLPPAPHGA
ncbi:MAG: DUF3126 family protein [Rhodovibrionaceae bacterium]